MPDSECARGVKVELAQSAIIGSVGRMLTGLVGLIGSSETVRPGSQGSFAGARRMQQLWPGPQGKVGENVSSSIALVCEGLGQQSCSMTATGADAVTGTDTGVMPAAIEIKATSPTALMNMQFIVFRLAWDDHASGDGDHI